MKHHPYFEDLIKRVCTEAGIEDAGAVLNDGILLINGLDVAITHEPGIGCVAIRVIVGTIPPMVRAATLTAMLEWNTNSSADHLALVDGEIAVMRSLIPLSAIDMQSVCDLLMDEVERMQDQWEQLTDRVCTVH